jgi:pyruvate, water dikinase
VTGTTDPDWVPIMKKAAAIITDHGGRTSPRGHRVSANWACRPSSAPGCDACAPRRAGGHGRLFERRGRRRHRRRRRIEVETLDLSHIAETRTGVMLNLANPSGALRWWRLPAAGVGLARMEFVVNSAVRIHPMALVRHDSLRDEAAKAEIGAITAGYTDKSQYFVDTLARGLSRIAAVHYPIP